MKKFLQYFRLKQTFSCFLPSIQLDFSSRWNDVQHAVCTLWLLKGIFSRTYDRRALRSRSPNVPGAFYGCGHRADELVDLVLKQVVKVTKDDE